MPFEAGLPIQLNQCRQPLHSPNPKINNFNYDISMLCSDMETLPSLAGKML